MVKIVPTSQFHKKSESHQRSCSHFATPMMVLYRKWANELGAKWPNWNTNFARSFCEANAKKRPENPHNFLIERPPSSFQTNFAVSLCNRVSYPRSSLIHLPTLELLPLVLPQMLRGGNSNETKMDQTWYRVVPTYMDQTHNKGFLISFLYQWSQYDWLKLDEYHWWNRSHVT